MALKSNSIVKGLQRRTAGLPDAKRQKKGRAELQGGSSRQLGQQHARACIHHACVLLIRSTPAAGYGLLLQLFAPHMNPNSSAGCASLQPCSSCSQHCWPSMPVYSCLCGCHAGCQGPCGLLTAKAALCVLQTTNRPLALPCRTAAAPEDDSSKPSYLKEMDRYRSMACSADTKHDRPLVK